MKTQAVKDIGAIRTICNDDRSEWVAYFNGFAGAGPIGGGKTEAQAIEDLRNQLDADIAAHGRLQ